MPEIDEYGDPARVRASLGDGTFGGAYERPDEDMLRRWSVAGEEGCELRESRW